MNHYETPIKPVVILHIMQDSFARGGTPIKLLGLVKHTDSQHLKHIFLFFANNPINLNRDLEMAGAKVIEVSRRKRYDVRLLQDIIKAIHAYQVDVISTHFARADIYGAIAGVITGKPIIRNVHGILWNESRGLQFLNKALNRFREITVYNSRATWNEDEKIFRAHRARLIYNGVIDRVHPVNSEEKIQIRKKLHLPISALIIGHVGGMIPVRDQETIISSVSLLKASMGEVCLLLIGDGPLRSHLEEKATVLGISQYVKFLGYRDDISALLCACDIYVNMAYKEGFGIAVIEAMQAELPVVLANAGALPELIEDGVSGILTPPGDVHALANSLIKLARNSGYAKQLGQQARRKYLQDFSITRYVKEMEDLYLSTIRIHE